MHRGSWLAAGSALALALGANLWAEAAYAQDKDADAEVSEVIVTGSFIPGTPEDAAIPVEAITFEEIRNQGSPSNMDLIKSMTEIAGVLGETNRNNANPVGAGQINLRGLSAARTVVLFNNRRWSEQFQFPNARFNDTQQIPNAVVGRVEIVKDGGNAIYGADAVGGVVNYISRKNFTGLEMNASSRFIEGADTPDYDASVLWGKSWDNGSILGALQYIHRGRLDTRDRDYAIREYLEAPSALGFVWSSSGSPGAYTVQSRRTGGVATGPAATFGGSTVGPGFSSIGLTGTGINQYQNANQLSLAGITGVTTRQIGGAQVRDLACDQLGGFAGWSATAPVCYFHTSVYDTLAEESETYSAYVEGDYEFSSALKFHGEAYYYHNKLPDIVVNPSDAITSNPLGAAGCSGTVTVIGTQTSCAAPNVAGFSAPANNPAVASFLAGQGYTPAQIAAVTDPTNLGRVFLVNGTWRPFGMGGNPISTNKGADRQTNERNSYRVVGEFKGDLGKVLGWDINYSLAGVYQTTRYQIQTTDMVVDRLQLALNGRGGPGCDPVTGTPGVGPCKWFNPFSSAIASNATSGEVNTLTYNSALVNDPAMVAWLYDKLALDRHTDLYVADFLLNGSGGIELWGGPVAWAIGAQYRKTTEENDVTDNNQVGRTLFTGQTVEALNPCPTIGVTDCSPSSRTGPLAYRRAVGGIRRDYKREYPSVAFFAELALPIFDRLNADFAVRHEEFESDLTDDVAKVWVGSGSVKWQVTDNFFLRGTAGNTFSNDVGQEQDVLRTANTTVATFQTFQIAGATTLSSPTPSLKPEKGFNFNVGGGVNIGNFKGTLDYYNIKIKNIARTLTADALVASLVSPGATGPTARVDCSSTLLDNDPALSGPSVKLAGNTANIDQHTYCNGLGANATVGDPDGTGPLVGLITAGSELRYFTGANGGDQTTSGIDASAQYRFDEALGGVLTVSADVTYILTYDVDDFIVNGVKFASGYDGIGLFNEATGRNGQRISRWRGNVGFNFTHGRHNLNWSTRVISSLTDDSTTRFVSSSTQNANIADATGVTNASLCASGGIILSEEGQVPAGAGTGVNGGSTPTALTSSTTLGYQAACNVTLLTGRKIPTTFNTDVTYRVNLPWDTSLSFTVYNLFDKDPPFSRCNTCGYGYDAFTGNPLGRNYKVQVTKRF